MKGLLYTYCFARGARLEPAPTRSGITLRQEGEAMTLAVRIISPVMLVSLLGCASQILQTFQPVAEKTQEEQPKKPAMPNDSCY